MEPGIPNYVRRPAQSKGAKGIPIIKCGASQDSGSVVLFGIGTLWFISND